MDMDEAKQSNRMELDYASAKPMKVDELRNQMELLGLNSRGTKRNLLNRLKFYTSARFTRKRSITAIEEKSEQGPSSKRQKIQQQHDYKQVLQNYVNNACDLNTLKGISQHISLLNIKHDIMDQIDESNSAKIRKMYHDTLPIDDIFPSALLQHILSFSGFYNTKGVNKQWLDLSQRNEIIYMQNAYADIICRDNDYESNWHSPGTTWIVAKGRTSLNPIEIRRGYKGPINSLYDAINTKATIDDRILVHDGEWNLPYNITIDLEIIGVGNNVICYPEMYFLHMSGSVLMENLEIKRAQEPDSKMREDLIYLTRTGSIFRNCIIDCDMNRNGIRVAERADLNVDNCAFIGGWCGSAIRVFQETYSLEITDCLFKYFGDSNDYFCGGEACIGCVSIMNFDSSYPVPAYWPEFEDEEPVFVHLKASGSVFKDNYCYPFAVIWPEDVEEHDQYEQSCEIINNTLRGYNESNKYNHGSIASNVANKLRNIQWNVKAAELG